MGSLNTCSRSQFAVGDGVFHCSFLCGQALARPGTSGNLPATRGLALVHIAGRRHEADDLHVESAEVSGAGATCRWRVGATALRLESAWTEDAATGVVSRHDRITNAGDQPAVLTGCLARVVLPPGHYECHTQRSGWCRENQGAWVPLHAGLSLTHVPGRTTDGATPYLAIRRIGTREGLAFHVLPRGDWTIRVTPRSELFDMPFAVIELGLADADLYRTISPGETFDLPGILIQKLPDGEPHLAAPALHRHLLRSHYAHAKPEAPVVFNTWFDQFEVLDVTRLRTQLVAAEEAGCEVFVIDAGWYGGAAGDWYAQAGDWREKTDAAFRGRMRDFADEVRAAGLGFGLWMEPERFGAGVPVRAAHPEWFLPAAGSFARIDLVQAPARAWLRAEIGRLVETYGLAWMKVDFNFSLGRDDSGAELADYTGAWYALMDEIRAAYPGTFFEGCSSGALRGDLETLRHFDGHFLSDTVHPVDMLRITQGAWLRLPPGRIARWAVLRCAGQVAPQYAKSVSDSPPVILAPDGAVWDAPVAVDVDFALLAGLPGMFGLSGDLAGLPVAVRGRLAAGVAFFKTWRRFIAGAVGHLLTPPETLECRKGWVALQLQAPAGEESLVFVYRMGMDAGAPPPVRLRGLDPAARYGLSSGLSETSCGVEPGADLMEQGLPPGLIALEKGRAAVFVVRRAKE